MRICPIDRLVNENFNVIFLNALQQFWRTTKSFQCFGNPKRQDLFLLLRDCRATYTDKAGRRVNAQSGDVIYAPQGSEYRAELSDFSGEGAHTVGINFHLTDACGEPLCLADGVTVFRAEGGRMLPLLFGKALRHDSAPTLTENRILLMEILSALAPHTARPAAPAALTRALTYLSEHIEENPTVTSLASLCGVSEVYLRRLFRAHTGTSPLAYRNALRLARARTYLEYGEVSVQEISDMLGYATASHFIKEFGRQYGTSPLAYRTRHRHR